ncbi:MAG: HEAT repeat domain-containing protein [Candidatus Hydrogenedentes bacterium]|nr:HEAT repeat domain-containing protein [Candidatus Hydrogenedentota bacterium]
MNSVISRSLTAIFLGVFVGTVLAPGLQAQEAAPADEAAALAVLQSGGDWNAMQNAFRQLRQVGTEQSVPVLAGFLGNEQWSHLAVYALEPMPIPEAGEALRTALGIVGGAPQLDIIGALGVRRDNRAVKALSGLMSSDDADLARRAAAALGKIASGDSVKALTQAHEEALDPKKLDISEALLEAAQIQVKEGKGRSAAKIYQALLAEDRPLFIRMGAFSGLAYADPKGTPERLIAALGGDGEIFRNVAVDLVAETSGEGATKEYVAALDSLEAEGKAALIHALSKRKDPAAHDAILAAVDNGEPIVRLAAIDALGALGTAEDIGLLSSLLAAGDDEAAATARNSLIRMESKDINDAIAASIGEASPAVRAKVLEVLDVRLAPQVAALAAEYLKDADADVRLASMQVLVQNGGAAELSATLEALKLATDPKENKAAARALNGVAKRAGETGLPIVLPALEGADEALKIALVEALGQVGGANALPPVATLAQGPESPVQAVALRVLSDWPTLDAAPTLLELAKSTTGGLHDAGIRGYVRLARSTEDAAAKGTMLDTAMKLANRKEEQWLVLSAYGTLATGESLAALTPYLKNAEVGNEAALAMIAVADAVRQHGDAGKVAARGALDTVMASTQDENVRQNAQAVMDKMK